MKIKKRKYTKRPGGHYGRPKGSKFPGGYKKERPTSAVSHCSPEEVATICAGHQAA